MIFFSIFINGRSIQIPLITGFLIQDHALLTVNKLIKSISHYFARVFCIELIPEIQIAVF